MLYTLIAGSLATNKKMTARLHDLYEAEREGFEEILSTSGILASCTRRGNLACEERKEVFWGVRRECREKEDNATWVVVEMVSGRFSVQDCLKEWVMPRTMKKCLVDAEAERSAALTQ